MTGRSKHSLIVLAVAIAVACTCSFGSVRKAEALPVLWQKCPAGSAAGECSSPSGVATNPDTGSVYVVDSYNRRINEFSPWGSFVKAWGWGVADGSPEAQSCGPGATPPTASCQKGIRGAGSGQFAEPRGIAVDSVGNLYVYESKLCTGGIACEVEAQTNRVQKFSSAGDFILMFGKEVNLTKVAERKGQEAAAEPVTVTPEEENICTAASGDTCGPGTQGSGNGEFGTGPLRSIDPTGSFIAVGPGDKIEVGGQERIQIFTATGHFEKSISIPGKLVTALALDAVGNAFVAYAQPDKTEAENEEDVAKLDSLGNVVCVADVTDPKALTVDALGRLYVASGSPLGAGGGVSIHRFSAACVEEEGFAFDVTGSAEFGVKPTGIATSAACGMEGNLYYANRQPESSFLRAYYPKPDPVLCPPPSVSPTIEDQYAESAMTDSAVVRAVINPHFWPDTKYYLQWGTEDCKSQPDACQQTELFPGASLEGSDDAGVKTEPVIIEGLQPDTTYHYRFVASSGGGGPVYGAGAATQEDGLGNSVTTLPLPGPLKADCPNHGLRRGLSERLPDCRAYEMVSPVDKEGGEIRVLINSANLPTSQFQGSADGNRMAYSSYRAFANPKSSPYISQYIATRGATDWESTAVSPPQEGPRLLDTEVLESSYKGFSDDLCNGWMLHMFNGQVAPDALTGYSNIYRRDNCAPGDGIFEAITRVSPELEQAPGAFAPLPVLEFIPSLQGFSADGSHTVFRSAGHLEPGSSPCTPKERADNANRCPRQVYDFHDGQLSLVCVLPNGNPLSGNCSAGGGFEAEFKNTHNSVHHAVSADGSRIFWTAAATGPGRLFVRLNGTKTDLISNIDAWFWTAASDGSKVLYNVVEKEVKGSLFEYDVDEKTKSFIAGSVSGVMGASDDATKVYFTSDLVLTGDANERSQVAIPGENNLYRYDSEEEEFAFIATLSEEDVNNSESAINSVPSQRTSRVSPDGNFAAFTSSVSLTGAENLDAISGRPDTEVFLYDAASDRLRCVSCSPSGARPHGRERLGGGPSVAGSIPGWTDQTHPSRALSDDGRRLFFESTSRLLLSDTNTYRDVYEWQPGASQADCVAKGAELHLKKEGGCLSLISAQSSEDSEFLDASASGRDVFFTTEAKLVPRDPGGVDVYDAREGGGIVEPPPPGPPCVDEGCQQVPAPPPTDPTPPSATFHGPEGKPAKGKRCPKGKVRRKGRCVKKNKHHKSSKGKQGKRKSGGRR